MTLYRHTATGRVPARKLSLYAELMPCAVAKLVILAHVAIMAYLGYCLSVKVVNRV
jgi:hypothetical protein